MSANLGGAIIEVADLIVVNRGFLLMARGVAKSPAAELLTGMSRAVLDRLSRLSVEEIEGLAKSIRVSLMTFRLSGDELERLIELKPEQRADYALSCVANQRRI